MELLHLPSFCFLVRPVKQVCTPAQTGNSLLPFITGTAVERVDVSKIVDDLMFGGHVLERDEAVVSVEHADLLVLRNHSNVDNGVRGGGAENHEGVVWSVDDVQVLTDHEVYHNTHHQQTQEEHDRHKNEKKCLVAARD